MENPLCKFLEIQKIQVLISESSQFHGENKCTEIIMKQEAMSIEKMCFRDLGGTCNSIGTDSQRLNNVN